MASLCAACTLAGELTGWQVVCKVGSCNPSSDVEHIVGLLWTINQPDAESFICTTHIIHKRQTSMPPPWDLRLQSQQVSSHRPMP